VLWSDTSPPSYLYAYGRDTKGAAFADVDGDGYVDLLLAYESDYTGLSGAYVTELWMNVGNGTVAFTLAASSAPTGYSPVYGDVDGDGDADLFTSDGLWLNDGSGTFTAASGFTAANGLASTEGTVAAFAGSRWRWRSRPLHLWCLLRNHLDE
jgi:hypothetical protein